MINNSLTKNGNIRQWLLNSLTEEDCIQIIKNADIRLSFKPTTIKEVRGKRQEVKEIYSVFIRDFNKALHLNDKGAISRKANLTNCMEFSDKYYTLRTKEGRVSVITPKGVILFCLCTGGNSYVHRIWVETSKFLQESEEVKYMYEEDRIETISLRTELEDSPAIEDKLSQVFRRVNSKKIHSIK